MNPDRSKEGTMISKGQTLHNPVTGEHMTFLETSASTGGEYVLIELHSDPGGFVAAAHVYPHQTEEFHVVRGTLGAKVDGRRTVATTGGRIRVHPGESHKWWNAGDDELVFRCRIAPAPQFESLIETMFGLAADGKTNRKGMPNLMRLAVIARHHFETAQLPVVPSRLQKLALAVGAPAGRLLGYEPTYQAKPTVVPGPRLVPARG